MMVAGRNIKKICLRHALSLRSNLPPDFTRRIAAIPVYTRAFLDATMKNDAQGERMLARTPAENGFDGWVTVRDLRRRP